MKIRLSLNNLFIPLAACSFAACNTGNADRNAEKDYSLMVNTFIGTDFTGNTYPGATVPFGMVQLSPDNGVPGWHHIPGYYYPDSTIAGFSHTHLTGVGAGDMYDIMYMPVTNPYNEAKDSPLGIHSKFSHDRESSFAGYYQVMLDDYGINVELTATDHCGIQRYTFPEADASVFLNLKKAMNWDATVNTAIEVVDSTTLRGFRSSTGWAKEQTVYFYARLSRPFDKIDIEKTPIKTDGKTTGEAAIARMDFKTNDKEQLVIMTGLSSVSMEGAQKNLEAETDGFDFEQYVGLAKEKWNKELAKIEITTGDKDLETVFYTALYHTMTAPTILSDVDGQYIGADRKIHKADNYVQYGTFSLWDTYRAAHPLYTYLTPDRVNDMVKSLMAQYKEIGRLPVWNFYGNETDMMIGYHSVPVIVDAYMKGIGDFDAEEALEACIATANIDEYRGIGLYKKYGYIPYNLEGESLSKTLEYSFDDWCIARMAEKMGKKEVADEFYKRAGYYKNLYNPATRFIQPKDDKGNWIKDFDAEDYTTHITESNGWQYFWSVQHDMPGLVALTGKDVFKEKLDSMFTFHPTDSSELPIFSTGMIGQYAHGNEPSHHVAYLYNYTDEAWKTQKYVTEIMYDLYKNSPDGLCGNEDCGQMSAWFVMSAMGFYPVNPAGQQYELGSPILDKAVMKLANGKQFTVVAHNLSKENRYVQSVKVNGENYDKTYITHDMIMAGSTIEFEMGAAPKQD